MQQIMQCDKNLLIWINSHHNPVLDAILVPISYAGEMALLWIGVCILMLIFGKTEHRKTAIILLLTMIFVDRVISASLGLLYDHDRPFMALHGIRQLGIRWSTGSFPSGHAHSVWLATIIFGNRWPKLWIPLITFALLTCYSRPYLGMHYPIDVAAGAALGVVAGVTVVTVERRIVKRAKANAE